MNIFNWVGGGVLYWDRHHPNAFPLVPSAKPDERKQLFGGFTDDNVAVPLSYRPKTCKSHDDSSANTEADQINIDPNYKEAQDLLASNGLGDFLPKLYQALVNG